jgi:hypothetical protein
MLDPQFVAENADLVKENCRRRNVHADVDRAVALYQQRKQLTREVQLLHQRQNELQKQTGAEKDPQRRQKLIDEGRELRAKVSELEAQLRQVEADLRAVLYTIPNLTHPDAPPGSRSEDNRVIRTWGEPPRFSFRPKDHVALAEKLDLVDFEAGSSVTGPKFYFLKNEGALLELALVQYAFSVLLAEGFTPIITPDLGQSGSRRGNRLYSPRPGDTDIQYCQLRFVPDRHGGNHTGRHAPRSDSRRKTPAASLCGTVALFPYRSRCTRTGNPGTVPCAPVHESGNVCLLHTGTERALASGTSTHRRETVSGTGHSLSGSGHLCR